MLLENQDAFAYDVFLVLAEAAINLEIGFSTQVWKMPPTAMVNKNKNVAPEKLFSNGEKFSLPASLSKTTSTVP